MIPTVKPTKFTFELQEILDNFSKELNRDICKENFPRLHKNNVFNKRFSGVLDSFADVKSVTERLTENIQTSLSVESKIQKQEEINQELHYEASKLTEQNKSDLKTLYVNTKIFLDEYVRFICWIFNWRGVENSSITKFYKSLEGYVGEDPDINRFREKCLSEIKDIDENIRSYRDDEIVHNDKKHKQPTRWFINEMNGNVKFGNAKGSSLTPQEILFFTVELVDCSTSYCFEWLSEQIR